MMEKHDDSTAASKAAQPPESKQWGTRLMGQPANPTAHPENQDAALWHLRGDDEHPPYVQFDPVHRGGGGGSPMESILDFFNSWSKKAEDFAHNIWHNIQTAPNKTEAAMGKLSLTAKALTEGGFESIYRQTFGADPSDRLRKTFACYLSTSTGPVAGTLYLSAFHVAFCSDRPLSFKAPSGQDAWSYYKVFIPIMKIAMVAPVTMTENGPPRKYIQIATVDGHEFWFMGFVNYGKAMQHLLNAVSDHNAAATAGGGGYVVQAKQLGM